VLFDTFRDANPFFHLMEAVWMLAGEKAAAWPVKFNKQMAEYASDDGNYEGAYGYRWRRHFGLDQVQWAVDHLRDDPTSRRCVITMFDGFGDRSTQSKDIPCNTHLYLSIVDGSLDMMVCNRSNDAVWGCYGANAVHFSVLQEVIAAGIGVPVGFYRQVSNNLHVYPDIPKVREALENTDYQDMYGMGLSSFPLVADYGTFLAECERFVKDPYGVQWNNPFFYYVARPMYLAWEAYKRKDYVDAISWCEQIEDEAWQYACINWLVKRNKS
jgi:hypothetical protein